MPNIYVLTQSKHIVENTFFKSLKLVVPLILLKQTQKIDIIAIQILEERLKKSTIIVLLKIFSKCISLLSNMYFYTESFYFSN